MIVLGIESSAHTFGVGIVTEYKENFILADERIQYVPKHGGIHPRESSRFLAEKAPMVIEKAFEKASLQLDDVNAIAVALGPGLGPCLRVGATAARALASFLKKPLVPVNHAVAHIEIGLKMTGLQDPVVVYLSGGNTAVIAYVEKRYRIFGETLDIALGNLLDTFARETSLGPPYVVAGMHVVDKCAESGKKFLDDFPYVVKGQDVAFSGLLTTALRAYRRGLDIHDICLTMREIAYNSVLEVTARCLMHTRKKEVMLVGGVAASPILREKFAKMAEKYNAIVGVVPPQYAVDNGVMIAWTGLLAFKSGLTIDLRSAIVKQRWRVDEVEIIWK